MLVNDASWFSEALRCSGLAAGVYYCICGLQAGRYMGIVSVVVVITIETETEAEIC